MGAFQMDDCLDDLLATHAGLVSTELCIGAKVHNVLDFFHGQNILL